jgi:hypothetical protein
VVGAVSSAVGVNPSLGGVAAVLLDGVDTLPKPEKVVGGAGIVVGGL